MNTQQLNELFVYEPASGRMRWKITKARNVKAGSIAGYKEVSGYITIGIDGKHYSNHRLIWILHNGDIPDGMHIDHINGKPGDDRIENLRIVTHAENIQNQRRAQSDNKSTGVLGVHKTKSGKFRSTLCVKGKNMYLGLFNTPEEAHQVYLQAKRNLHGGCTI